MNPTPLETEVKEFVARTTSVRPDKLAPGTRLAQDIGVDGDDGDDLMAAFGKQFGVDLSEFRTESHFGQEGNAFAYLLGLAGPPRTRFIPITIADLVAAARSGRWLTPDREPV